MMISGASTSFDHRENTWDGEMTMKFDCAFIEILLSVAREHFTT
jgi:hypothetical protein